MTNRPFGKKLLLRERRVLVVDDSPAHRKVLSMQLTRAGYQVILAESGAEALRICREDEPDIVLSDWMMPGMSGPEFCAAFRRLPRRGYGYFILLTSKTDKSDIAFGLENGADDFLCKPVSSAELLARLSAAERILRMQEDLTASNAQLTQTLERLRAIQAEHERDLNDARRLHEGLLRQNGGRLGGFDISLLLRPAGHVGGDLVGFFPIDGRRVGIYAIDVSGHGVAAALLTARLAAYLNGAGDQNVALQMTPLGLYDARPPAELVGYFNHMLLTEMRTDAYMTMVYAELDFLSGKGRLVQAGHPHPLIQRSTGKIERIGQGGIPVGVFESATYDEVPFHLAPGDRLLIASDGITETQSPQGRLLGEEGLKAIMQTNAFLRGQNMLESLSWSLSNFAGGERGDDISAVLLEYTDKAD